MKCLEIARLKDFAPNTPGLLGVAQGPQTPCRELRDSRCVSTNPPLEIPAYGPGIVMMIDDLGIKTIMEYKKFCYYFNIIMIRHLACVEKHPTPM